ncbi:hypothetical protein ANN_16209 [Periplaneta americana]|uniref:Transposable element Tc3 transposase n=1 Tax=Periplaneta americana TaxID=6978 RepID=A0ABQ8SJL2_PERAM|nr:hypothetical protein ANN_16209 [Periplaneta americana]
MERTKTCGKQVTVAVAKEQRTRRSFLPCLRYDEMRVNINKETEQKAPRRLAGWTELLENIPLNIRERIWFQHDGVPPHFDRRARNHLNATFPYRWIGRGGPVTWPPRSPDLTPLDFFLCGDMKRLVYETPIDTAEDLVARVVEAAHVIRDNVGLFERCRHSIVRRYQLCNAFNERQFKHHL